MNTSVLYRPCHRIRFIACGEPLLLCVSLPFFTHFSCYLFTTLYNISNVMATYRKYQKGDVVWVQIEHFGRLICTRLAEILFGTNAVSAVTGEEHFTVRYLDRQEDSVYECIAKSDIVHNPSEVQGRMQTKAIKKATEEKDKK